MSNPYNDLPPIMAFAQMEDRHSRRRRAAQLLEAVLEEQIEPRLAINRWPNCPEEPDSSLDCAYQALWHFEADEDKQQTELFYMDAQLELLRQIAAYLSKGHSLPPHILRMYDNKSGVRFFYDLPLWKDSICYLKRVQAELREAWDQIWAFCRSNQPRH